jgi:hypothetical protein
MDQWGEQTYRRVVPAPAPPVAKAKAPEPAIESPVVVHTCIVSEAEAARIRNFFEVIDKLHWIAKLVRLGALYIVAFLAFVSTFQSQIKSILASWFG